VIAMQRLPLPVGSPHAVRQRGRAWRSARWGRPLVALAGLAAAAAGAALGAAPPVVTAGLDRQGYHVAGATLPAHGDGVYAGPEAAVVIAGEPEATRAAGSTTLRGARMLGSCTLPRGARSEGCAFELDGRPLTAVDDLRGGGWDRRYSDGQTARIELVGGRPVPVPIAVGR
jgi:hypothetical protein